MRGGGEQAIGNRQINLYFNRPVRTGGAREAFICCMAGDGPSDPSASIIDRRRNKCGTTHDRIGVGPCRSPGLSIDAYRDTMIVARPENTKGCARDIHR